MFSIFMAWHLVVIRYLPIKCTRFGVFNFSFIFLNNIVARQVYLENCRCDVYEVTTLFISSGSSFCLRHKTLEQYCLARLENSKKSGIFPQLNLTET